VESSPSALPRSVLLTFLIADVRGYTRFTVEQGDDAAARLAANHRLRGADAVYVSVAHVMNLPLVSWDREVQSRARGYITILQP
jgi:predicted nucleic acid-binding protein